MKRKSTKTLKPRAIPHFKNEDEEFAFWSAHDLTDYFDVSQARSVTFPNIKPSTTTISLRLPLGMLDSLKRMANTRDVPYQSLLKMLVADALKREKIPPRK